MNIVVRVAVLVFFLFAAIGCYAFGIPAGGVVFFVLGLVFEGMFWMGVFGKRKKSV